MSEVSVFVDESGDFGALATKTSPSTPSWGGWKR